MRADYGAGIYSEEFTRRTYAALIEHARTHLERGQGVIIDATFRHPAERREIMEIALRAGFPLLFVECRAASHLVLRRLRERETSSGEVSDADAGVYLRQHDDFVALDEIPQACRVVVNTAHSLARTIDEIEAALARVNVKQ